MEQFDKIEFCIEFIDKMEDEYSCTAIWASDESEARKLFQESYPSLIFEIVGVEPA